jgi:hypothetical protein
VVLAALGKREKELELDPNATVFGEPERNIVRQQAVRVWRRSLMTGAALAIVGWTVAAAMK